MKYFLNIKMLSDFLKRTNHNQILAIFLIHKGETSKIAKCLSKLQFFSVIAPVINKFCIVSLSITVLQTCEKLEVLYYENRT